MSLPIIMYKNIKHLSKRDKQKAQFLIRTERNKEKLRKKYS